MDMLTERIQLMNNINFIITLYSFKSKRKNLFELINNNKFNELNTSIPSLVYYFGIDRFIIISPVESHNLVNTESRAKLIFSGISIAAHKSSCQIPIFVQLHEHNRNMYAGYCMQNSLKINFEMVHLNYTPPQYADLSGLLEIYKSKFLLLLIIISYI